MLNAQPVSRYIIIIKKIFKLDGVELNVSKDALEEIAEIATNNKTGARGLRSVLEKSLLKLQFKLPKLSKNAGLVSVEINGDFIKNGKDPILVFKEKKGKTKSINE